MNETTNIIEVNESDFNDKVIEASENKLIIVDFWAPWCGPCKQLTPVLEKIVKSSVDKLTLVKINIDDNQQIAAQLRIQSIPTVYAFKGKQIVVRCSADCKPDVESALSQTITHAITNGWALETLETVVECIRDSLSKM